MLQSLSIKPTRPVLRAERQLEATPTEPGARVEAVHDGRKPLSAVLHVFLDLNVHPTQLASLATTPSTSSAEDDAATPDYSLQCDLSDLRKLRSKLQKCVGHGRHCSRCKCIADYLSFCWERPRLLHRTWDGAATLQMEPLAHFLNQLLMFACQLESHPTTATDAHEEFVNLVAAFFQPNKGQ